MKRVCLFALAILLVAGLILGGCAKAEPTAPTTPTPTKPTPIKRSSRRQLDLPCWRLLQLLRSVSYLPRALTIVPNLHYPNTMYQGKNPVHFAIEYYLRMV